MRDDGALGLGWADGGGYRHVALVLRVLGKDEVNAEPQTHSADDPANRADVSHLPPAVRGFPTGLVAEPHGGAAVILGNGFLVESEVAGRGAD